MDRKQILAFRLRQHHIHERLPQTKLALAASSGVLTGLGATAEAAFAARLEGFEPQDLEAALREKKTLVELSGPRAAGWIVPTQDFDVFTLGAAPASDDDIEKFIGNAAKHLGENDVSPSLAMKEVLQASRKVLRGRALTQDEIHAEWRNALPRELLYSCKGCKSWHVHWMLVGAIGLTGAFCYGPIREGDSAFVRPEDWLPKARRRLNPDEASRELARRYLRFYGPSTCTDFGDWAGLSPRRASETWDSIARELHELQLKGKKAKPAWILREDLKMFESSPSAKVARLLPPRDPFLDLRDRETLVPEESVRSRVWRILGNPGVLLIEGEVAGTWRAKKKGKDLEVAIERVRPIAKPWISRIEEEAAAVAKAKGLFSARVKFDEG